MSRNLRALGNLLSHFCSWSFFRSFWFVLKPKPLTQPARGCPRPEFREVGRELHRGCRRQHK